MPELPPYDPSVTVFHFTSKVSSAKIKKYKLATERGMTNNQHAVISTKLNDLDPAETLSVKEISSNEMAQHQWDDSEDNLILAHPDGRTVKKRNWSSAFTESGNAKQSTREPSTSSDLSSCDPEVLATTAPPPEPASKPAKTNDDYGDFMSYYVLDDDEQDSTQNVTSEVTRSKEQPKKPVKKPVNTVVAKPRKRIRKSSITQSVRQQDLPFKTSASRRAPQQPRIIQSPKEPIIPPKRRSLPNKDVPTTTDTISVMIEKIEHLSAALTTFGAPPPKSETIEIVEESSADEVDSFLAMFGEQVKQKPTVQVHLGVRGIQDDSIRCGIQFIMNALRSWAEGRIAFSNAQVQSLNTMAAQRRGPGRPRKDSSDVDELDPSISSATLSMLDTPEGRAIEAFRAVMESGCLRMNAPMPTRLTKSLRNLYMQIDQIINKSPPSLHQQPWRCMSYKAQIEANKMKIVSWKQTQQKLLEASILQQRAAHQQVMSEMGIPSVYTEVVLYQQPRNTFASECGVRPGSHGLILLQPQPQTTTSTVDFSQASVDAATAAEIHTFQTSSTSFPQVSQINAQAAARNFLRSGQSMKFSFAPSNSAAIQAFGAAAFPALHKPDAANSTKPNETLSDSTTLKDKPADVQVGDDPLQANRSAKLANGELHNDAVMELEQNMQQDVKNHKQSQQLQPAAEIDIGTTTAATTQNGDVTMENSTHAMFDTGSTIATRYDPDLVMVDAAY